MTEMPSLLAWLLALAAFVAAVSYAFNTWAVWFR